jgi:membrane protein implicated in regulation of membrane protease activity
MSTNDVPGQSLWEMIVSPTIWAVHFLLCYIVAAVYCAKIGLPAADLAPVRVWVAFVTLIALSGIAASGIRASRRGRFEARRRAPHDADTIEDRQHFLADATILLSGLSFVATLYVAIAAAFVETCR